MILRLKRCDRMSPSRFYAMLRKFLSDFNEICTIGAHYDGDHITKVVAQDDKYLFSKFFLASCLSPPWKISNQGHRLDEITQKSPNYGRMPYWGRTWIVYGPIFMNIMFYWDFLGSGRSLFFAGSNFLIHPVSMGISWNSHLLTWSFRNDVY